MGDRRSAGRLGRLIKSAREARELTQVELAKAIGPEDGSSRYVSRLETGAALPSHERLAEIHRVLRGDQFEDPGVDLAAWIACAVEDRAARVQDNDSSSYLKSAAKHLSPVASATPVPNAGRGTSLAEFPSAFSPFAVVIGDRREPRPKTRSDLFARSLSTVDLAALPKLGRYTTEVVSDKLFDVMPKPYLVERFGSANLLVIGSDAVNLAARQLGRRAIFRSPTDPVWLEWDAQIRKGDDLRMDRDLLRAYWALAKTVNRESRRLDLAKARRSLRDTEPSAMAVLSAAADLVSAHLRGPPGQQLNRGLWTIDEIVDQFLVAGFPDPVDGTLRGRTISMTSDVGAVSLAPHPFAKRGSRHVAILVRGVSGPATYTIMSKLSKEPKWFGDRPLGGVVRVALPGKSERWWPAQVETASATWETPPYTAMALAQRFATNQLVGTADRDPAFAKWTLEELSASERFVHELAGDDA